MRLSISVLYLSPEASFTCASPQPMLFSVSTLQSVPLTCNAGMSVAKHWIMAEYFPVVAEEGSRRFTGVPASKILVFLENESSSNGRSNLITDSEGRSCWCTGKGNL